MADLPNFKFIADKSSPENAGLKILSFDPGETVGWCVWQDAKVIASGQVRTTEWTYAQITDLLEVMAKNRPDVVIYESYRVYAWKTDSHAWDEVHTAQIIGIIRLQCMTLAIPYIMQTAQVAKQFMTDDKLVAWGLWKRGERHARDAIRHAAWYRVFGKASKMWGRLGAPKE